MLTDTAIRKAKANGKRAKLFDGGGMYLEVTPSGGKWWRLKYRHAGRKSCSRSASIPRSASAAAREQPGGSPQAARRRNRPKRAPPSAHARLTLERDANTFEVVAREWYEKNAPGWAESHALPRSRPRLEREVFPFIGGWPIAEMTPPEILRRASPHREPGGSGNCPPCPHGTSGPLFRYAIATGRADRERRRRPKGRRGDGRARALRGRDRPGHAGRPAALPLGLPRWDARCGGGFEAGAHAVCAAGSPAHREMGGHRLSTKPSGGSRPARPRHRISSPWPRRR